MNWSQCHCSGCCSLVSLQYLHITCYYLLLQHSPSTSQWSHVCFNVPSTRMRMRLPNLQLSPVVIYIRAHPPGEDTPPAIIEAYHLEPISHHPTSKWAVCFLPCSPPPPSEDEPAGQAREMTPSASHWASWSSNKTQGARRGEGIQHVTRCNCFAMLVKEDRKIREAKGGF